MRLQLADFMLVFGQMTSEERLHMLAQYGEADKLRQQADAIDRAMEARITELLPIRDEDDPDYDCYD